MKEPNKLDRQDIIRTLRYAAKHGLVVTFRPDREFSKAVLEMNTKEVVINSLALYRRK